MNKYEEALEKACVLLDEFVYFIPKCIVPEEIKGSSADDNCILKSEKEWKEWLLKWLATY